MSAAESRPPRAVIFGCAGPALSAAERAFFASVNPLGFILFRRNIETPEQVRGLVAALRESVGREDAPVLVDQEGGRVQRLTPPHWHAMPPAAAIGRLAAADFDAAVGAAWSAGRVIAGDLAPLGISVDCAPCCDVRFESTHDAIGDRSFATDAGVVGELAAAFAAGLAAGKITPVIKHLPGHGRAEVDSHLALPVVTAAWTELERNDFRAFSRVADLPWGMTGHVLYTAIDAARPATCSPIVIARAIRGAIGFDGLLLTDDLSMKALGGGVRERASAALQAGCDVALHCNGEMAEMQEIASAIGEMSDVAVKRHDRTSYRLELTQYIKLSSEVSEMNINDLYKHVQVTDNC